MEQATDFLTESDTLAAILHDLDDQAWDRPTQFKGWTINDVLVHLHFWNRAADQSLTDPDGFQDTMRSAIAASAVSGMRAVENAAVNERSSELLATWAVGGHFSIPNNGSNGSGRRCPCAHP